MKFFLWIVYPTFALAQTPAPAQAPAPPLPKPPETFQSAMEKQRASIALQREAVRKQMEVAREDDIPTADCPPIGELELIPLIQTAARQHQLEPKLIRSVIEQESAFHACAISSKGAKGLMQLMPSTIERFKVEDAFDPQQNIEAGSTYLRQLLDKYKGDLKLTLAAYNSGPTTVDKTGAIPDIKETRDYVEGVLKKMQ